MSSQLPDVALIENVAKRIPDRDQGQQLNGLSRRIANNHSCLTDLRYCQQIVELLEREFVAHGIDEHHRLIIQHSLMCHAAILYARATVSGGRGGGRGAYDIAAKLDEGQQSEHSEIVEFRNKIVAHVHIGHDLHDYVWNPAHALVVKEADGWSVGAVSRPVSVRESIFNRLKGMTPIAIEIVKAKYDEYLDKAWDIIEGLEDFSAVEECLQSPVDLMGSESAAAAVLFGRADGPTFGIARDE